MFQIEGREVAMDAAGTLSWRATELADGTLYLPSQPEDAERTVDLLTSARLDNVLNEGNAAQIFLPPADQPDDVVVKQYHSYVSPSRGALPDLRVNVLTEAGLAEIAQRHPYWQLRGPKIMGAFVSKEVRRGSPGRKSTRWVMERVVAATDTVEQLHPKDRTHVYVGQGATPDYDDTHPLPRLSVVKELCDRALGETVGDAAILDYAVYSHDIGPSNVLIEQLPQGVNDRRHKRKTQQKGSVVKIDAEAYAGFDY
jgi:hypothetical protein